LENRGKERYAGKVSVYREKICKVWETDREKENFLLIQAENGKERRENLEKQSHF
jgi:hypothetical protein